MKPSPSSRPLPRLPRSVRVGWPGSAVRTLRRCRVIRGAVEIQPWSVLGAAKTWERLRGWSDPLAHWPDDGRRQRSQVRKMDIIDKGARRPSPTRITVAIAVAIAIVSRSRRLGGDFGNGLSDRLDRSFGRGFTALATTLAATLAGALTPLARALTVAFAASGATRPVVR